MIDKGDEEIAKLLEVSRVSVNRWRNGKRYPKFDEVLKYEEKLGLPFECFSTKEPDLKAIRDKLKQQLEAIEDLLLSTDKILK